MTKNDVMKASGMYVNDNEGYAIVKAKYSELVSIVGVRNVRLHTVEGKIKVTNESKEG